MNCKTGDFLQRELKTPVQEMKLLQTSQTVSTNRHITKGREGKKLVDLKITKEMVSFQ